MVFRSGAVAGQCDFPADVLFHDPFRRSFFPLLNALLLCGLLAVLLPGCGLMDYFTEDDVPREKHSTSEVVSAATAQPRAGIGSISTLLDLERFLIDRSPALDLLRSEVSEARQNQKDEQWLPGSEVRDSSKAGLRDSVRMERERSLTIDWRPLVIRESDRRGQVQRSRYSVAIAKLRVAESKLLRLLREEWSELWFQQQVISITSSALAGLDLSQEVGFDPASPTAPILLETLRTRWIDRIDGIEQETRKTCSRINSLLGRATKAVLPLSVEPGDDRFQHIDQLTDRRLHPREIIADEQLALASFHLEDTEGGDWPEIVVGAQSQADADAPVTGSSEEHWTFTLGVEFPLGRQGKDLRVREARNRFGSARAQQMMARRAIEDEIAAARAQLLASLQRIDEIEDEVIPSLEEVLVKLPQQAASDRFEAHLRVDDGLLEARLGRIRAMADRARARFSLIDLLGLERSEPNGPYSRMTP